MPTNTVQVIIPTDDAVSANYCTNTWHFTTVASKSEATADIIDGHLATFYGTLGAHMSSLNASTFETKWYDLADAKPRAPWHEGAFAVAPGAGNALPSEVAVVVSYHGVKQSGVPMARRRGRLYIGPLGAQILGIGADQGRLLPAVRDSFGAAAHVLLQASLTAQEWSWSVYSPTNNFAVDVVGGWIDNAFDTQRRRGVQSTSRSTFGTSTRESLAKPAPLPSGRGSL